MAFARYDPHQIAGDEGPSCDDGQARRTAVQRSLAIVRTIFKFIEAGVIVSDARGEIGRAFLKEAHHPFLRIGAAAAGKDGAAVPAVGRHRMRSANMRHRPVGLGVMGFQDALYTLDLGYASDGAVDFAERPGRDTSSMTRLRVSLWIMLKDTGSRPRTVAEVELHRARHQRQLQITL
ncbi:MAG: hypothetical protein HC788_14850, partial [Sphingopyxis sp.]|nr:hypothetical protein [Sphingopyxis sp.]